MKKIKAWVDRARQRLLQLPDRTKELKEELSPWAIQGSLSSLVAPKINNSDVKPT